MDLPVARIYTEQGRLFQSVDHTWREHMQKTLEDPAVLSVARRTGFLDALVDANDKLDTIQKGLNDYLETKRLVRKGEYRYMEWKRQGAGGVSYGFAAYKLQCLGSGGGIFL